MKSTMKLIDSQRKIMELINNHQFDSAMSYDETIEYLGIAENEKPTDFFSGGFNTTEARSINDLHNIF